VDAAELGKVIAVSTVKDEIMEDWKIGRLEDWEPVCGIKPRTFILPSFHPSTLPFFQ
jgi:hypothetical protein